MKKIFKIGVIIVLFLVLLLIIDGLWSNSLDICFKRSSDYLFMFWFANRCNGINAFLLAQATLVFSGAIILSLIIVTIRSFRNK